MVVVITLNIYQSWVGFLKKQVYFCTNILILGQNVELAVARPVRSGPPPFSVGDKVQVTVNVEQLKAMQQGHGGWNPRMAEVMKFQYLKRCFLMVLVLVYRKSGHST